MPARGKTTIYDSESRALRLSCLFMLSLELDRARLRAGLRWTLARRSRSLSLLLFSLDPVTRRSGSWPADRPCTPRRAFPYRTRGDEGRRNRRLQRRAVPLQERRKTQPPLPPPPHAEAKRRTTATHPQATPLLLLPRLHLNMHTDKPTSTAERPHTEQERQQPRVQVAQPLQRAARWSLVLK